MRFNYFMVGLVSLLLVACGSGSTSASNASSKLSYPPSATVDATNSYFTTTIADPYQWMESTTSSQTIAWVQAQNTFTQNYLAHLPSYAEIEQRMNEIYAPVVTDSGLAQKTGELAISKEMVKGNKVYYYQINKQLKDNNYYPQDKVRKVSVDNIIYVTDDPNKPGHVFLNLNEINPNPDDNIELTNFTLTESDTYLIYQLTRNYSDLSEIHVVNTATGAEMPDQTIDNTINNFIVYEQGFFYIKPTAIINPLTSPDNQQTINYHIIGQNVSQDPQLFSGGELLNLALGGIRAGYLYFYTGLDTTNEIYRLDPAQLSAPAEKFLGDDYQSSFQIFSSQANNFVIQTSKGAAQNRLVNVNPENTAESAWTNILPADSTQIVADISQCNGLYYAEILINGASTLVEYSEDGSISNNISLPGIGALGNMTCSTVGESPVFSYEYSTLATPWQTYTYNSDTKTSSLIQTSKINGYNPDNYEMQELFVPSTDGAIVSIFIGYKKGLVQNGNNPTYIHAYGGFNVVTKPSFTRDAIPLMDNGGIYVEAQVRGGGEYGRDWYNAGRMLNKMNTYDDVIAVASYLIKNNYTSAAKLGLAGGSNGGLTTAAVALLRPDLFAAVFPSVGVLDLLRYQLFTLGFAWHDDYGYSSDLTQFNNLMTFSPLQNVKSGVAYPAMYIETGQTDTRVAPLHSYKFAATMQNMAGGIKPYILMAWPKAGHQISQYREQSAANTWAFFFANTGTTYK